MKTVFKTLSLVAILAIVSCKETNKEKPSPINPDENMVVVEDTITTQQVVIEREVAATRKNGMQDIVASFGVYNIEKDDYNLVDVVTITANGRTGLIFHITNETEETLELGENKKVFTQTVTNVPTTVKELYFYLWNNTTLTPENIESFKDRMANEQSVTTQRRAPLDCFSLHTTNKEKVKIIPDQGCGGTFEVIAQLP